MRFTPNIIISIDKEKSIHKTHIEIDSRLTRLEIELQKRSMESEVYVDLLVDKSFSLIKMDYEFLYAGRFFVVTKSSFLKEWIKLIIEYADIDVLDKNKTFK